MFADRRACLICLVLLVPAAPTAVSAQNEPGTQGVDCDAACERERERIEKEKPARSSFFDRVHLDVLGAPPEIGGSTDLVGVVGAHLTIAEFGRINLYGPPGVMIAMASQSEGSSRWRPMTALTWGISIRLADFRFRGAARKTVVFINLTKLWTWGDFSQGTDFVGLSFAWKRDGNQPRVDPRWSRSTKRTSSATEPTASLDMTRPR
jgi:hypothetical protein